MKFHTAPMRLKRGSDLSDLQAAMSFDVSPGRRRADSNPTYSPTSDEGFEPDYGTWPKVSKRRTSGSSDSAMSLREVSEALAAAHIVHAPAAAEIDEALDAAFGLDALDALVSAELEAEAAMVSGAEQDDAGAERFVDAVFGEQRAVPPPPAAERRLSADEEALFAMCLQPQYGEMTELDGDELLAMLHEPLEDLDDVPAEVPASPSPTSVFCAPLSSGGATPPNVTAEARVSPHDFYAAVTHKLAQTAEPEQGKGALHNSRNAAERKEWTAAEDEIIRSSVSQHGCRWRRIAAQLPGRSDDAVRNRWNRLKADKSEGGSAADAAEGGAVGGGVAAPKRTSSTDSASRPERVSWTRAEDETILQSVHELGHKWNKLAERLPGRTDHAIRNRFHRLQTMMEDKQQPAPAARLLPPPADPFVGSRIFEAESLQPMMLLA